MVKKIVLEISVLNAFYPVIETEDEVVAVEQVADFLPKITNDELSRARINPVTLLFNSKDLEMHFIAFYHGVTGSGPMLLLLFLILKNGEFVKTNVHCL